jgi:hypothetical protein
MVSRSPKRVLAGVALVSAFSFGAGCSDDDDDDGVPGGLPIADDGAFLERYAGAVCRAIGPCCRENSYGYDAGRCQTAVEGVLLAFLVNPAKARGDTYDSAKAGDCIALVERRATSASCAEDGEGDGDLIDRTCDLVYRSGTKAPGEACERQEECAESDEGEVRCREPARMPGTSPPPGGDARVCQIEKAVAQVGDPCNGALGPPWVYSLCDGDDNELRCDAETRSCQPRLALGQDCGMNPGGCAADAYCAQREGDAFGLVCAPRLPVGGACRSDGDCVRDAFCDTDGTDLCVARRPAGEPCDDEDQCVSGACDAGRCLTNPIGTAVFCSPG